MVSKLLFLAGVSCYFTHHHTPRSHHARGSAIGHQLIIGVNSHFEHRWPKLKTKRLPGTPIWIPSPTDVCRGLKALFSIVARGLWTRRTDSPDIYQIVNRASIALLRCRLEMERLRFDGLCFSGPPPFYPKPWLANFVLIPPNATRDFSNLYL